METETNRDGNFVTTRLPWAVAAGMLVIYLFTINRWLTPSSLTNVTKMTGWDWHPAFSQPALFVITYPFRWLPGSIVPLVMNLFSAVCAALTLGLLARSVALLPQDRTFEQRQREQSEFSYLTIRSAWLPPVMAALVCGLQMSFWENAIDATGEMFDLLLFAYVIRCLLEYRVSGNESWLSRFALVYGLAMAENWAMVGFFPLFLVALVWIMGLNFLNWRFIRRTILLGALGFSLILLMPLLNSVKYHEQVSFLELLRFVYAGYKQLLLHDFTRRELLLLSLGSILPLFLIGIRWASHFGDTSPLGVFMATFSFHFVHLLFLVYGVWIALDSALSPRNVDHRVPFLTFYYLGALCIGYFAGYFLLVFGNNPGRSRRRTPPVETFFNRLVTSFVWLLFVAVPALLVARNLPQVQSAKNVSAAIEKYCAEVRSALPDRPVVLLSDDAFHLLYVEAALHHTGEDRGNLYLYTESLIRDPSYARFVAKAFPQFEFSKYATNALTNSPGQYNVALWLNDLQQRHDLYYLQPSFGFFSEEFCKRPHGVVYQLVHYATNEWLAPLPTPEEIRENEAFWRKAATDVFPVLTNAVQPRTRPANPNLWQRFLAAAHLQNRVDLSAFTTSYAYSRAINYWGVELERCGDLTNAGSCFEQALLLNPGNVSAKVNEAFNKKLCEGQKLTLHIVNDIEDQFGQHQSWDQILAADGPLDDPNFRLSLEYTYAFHGNLRQAVQEVRRVCDLVPDSALPWTRMSQLMRYVTQYPHKAQSLPLYQCMSNALDCSERAVKLEPDNASVLLERALSLMQAEDYEHSLPVFTKLLSLDSSNYWAVLFRAINYYELNRFDDAKKDYESMIAKSPNVYQAYWGLGQIAFTRGDSAEAIKNFELYLTNAPPNTPEFKSIQSTLEKLKSGQH